MKEDKRIYFAEDILNNPELETQYKDKMRLIILEGALGLERSAFEKVFGRTATMEKFASEFSTIHLGRPKFKKRESFETKIENLERGINDLKGRTFENKSRMNVIENKLSNFIKTGNLPILTPSYEVTTPINHNITQFVDENKSFYYLSLIVSMVGIASLFYGIYEKLLFYLWGGIFLIALVFLKFILLGREEIE